MARREISPRKSKRTKPPRDMTNKGRCRCRVGDPFPEDDLRDAAMECLALSSLRQSVAFAPAAFDRNPELDLGVHKSIEHPF